MTHQIHGDISEEEKATITRHLIEFADEFTGPRNCRELGFVIRGPDGTVLGGAHANTVWDWLQVQALWVSDDLRGRGYGRRLLECLESAARDIGCRFVRLNTFEFEAREFYESQGYTVASSTEGFPAGHTQHHLTKAL